MDMDMDNLTVENPSQGGNNRLIRQIVLVAAIILLAALLFAWFNSGRAAADSEVVQGSVKMTEIDLNSMLDGYIDEVLVAEGDHVQAGQVLIKMDADIVQAKVWEAEAALGQAEAGLAQAQAAQAAAQAVLDKAVNGARSEDIAQAKAQYDYVASTYERMKNLYAEGAISQSDYENAQAQYLAAEAVYNEATNGARSEDIAAARAQVQQAAGAVSQYQATIKQAEAAVAEANSYLGHTEITAPRDGVMTAVNVEAGELVSTGLALASLRADEDAWLEVNVPETMLGSITEGAKVSFTMPAYGDQTFKGTVQSVSSNPDFATKKATNENGAFDVLSYCVKIQPDDMAQTLYAGMTVVVDFGSLAGDE